MKAVSLGEFFLGLEPLWVLSGPRMVFNDIPSHLVLGEVRG